MGDAAEPFAAVEEPFESGPSAAARPAASSRVSAPGKAPAAAVPSSEGATLVCAVLLAVSLGVACGAWINTRLASAVSIAPPAPSMLLPAGTATVRKTPAASAATEPRPAGDEDPAPSAYEVVPAPDPAEATEAEAPGTDPAGTTDRESTGKRVAGVPGKAASGTGRTAKAAALPGGASHVERRGRAVQGEAGGLPCALYASAGSLAVRNGGAASLVVGGPGEAGRVTVSTPDWADIAVFPEGRAGGNGWTRYSVRSVSKRAGVYTVRFKTPCGSQNIPVTVARP
jgi:hypothetical protein